jgi:hypothetical protein
MQVVNKKIIRFAIISISLAGVFTMINGIAAENDLTTLLPDATELGQNVTADYQQKAEGEKLVELINGGAVLFFKHGFKRTVFQEYYLDSTQYINLEIYQMENPQGVKGIFWARADTSANELPFGEQGYQDDYYCTFYRETYYVIVTGSDTSQSIQKILLKSAEIVDKRIQTIKKFQE